MVKIGSQVSLIPIWFLAVYVGAVVVVPLTYAAWRRFGMASFWALATAAAVDDLLFFAADLRDVGWLNYGFIWLAVHQLGYAWRDEKLPAGGRSLRWSVAGLAILWRRRALVSLAVLSLLAPLVARLVYLVVKRRLLQNRVPTVPGGGTVSFVSSTKRE